MKRYVLCIAKIVGDPVPAGQQFGFVFVEKAEPAWQRGKLNFPGGKIEGDETPEAAAAREFSEETGVSTTGDQWEKFLVLQEAERFEVHVLRLRRYVCRRGHPGDTLHTPDGSNEPIHVLSMRDAMFASVDGRALSNVSWMAALSLDPDIDGRLRSMVATYGDRMPSNG